MRQSISGLIASVLLFVMLSALFLPVESGTVLAQGGVPDSVPAVTPDKGNPKLDSALNGLVTAAQNADARAPLLQSTTVPEDRVQVIIECSTDDYNQVVKPVTALGATFETGYGNLLQASVPVSSLTALTANPNINFIRLPMEPVYDEVTSQGVGVINATAWQAVGINGTGVKIGVLDGGFYGYEALLGTELPASVTTYSAKSNIYNNTTHGTSCAEIVHDVAPNAQMYLTNFGTELEYRNAVDWLISQQVDVITSSVGWPVSGPGDGTGLIDDAINKAANAGIFVSISAGNMATQHWQGDWSDTDNDTYLEFIPGGLDENGIQVSSTGKNITLGLIWDDPWDNSTNDYDLILYRDTGETAQFSANPQNGGDVPREFISFTPTIGNYYVKIQAVNSPDPVHFHLYSFSHTLAINTAAGSLTVPADAENVTAVGAVYWNSGVSIEGFSSHGPTADGRIKPDLVAPDGVSVSSGAFYGTSAAAPHVGGAAALVKQAFPDYTREQITAFLEENAFDLGDPGKDNTFGSGRLDLGSISAFLSIEVDPVNSSILSGRTEPFSATGTYYDNSTKDITANVNWSSGNSSVVAIDPLTGLAAGLRGGQTLISAEMYGISGSTGVFVPTSLEVNSGESFYLPAGKQLTAGPSSGVPVVVKGLPASFSPSNGLKSFSMNLTWDPAEIDLVSISPSQQALDASWNIVPGSIDHTGGTVSVTGSTSSPGPDDLSLFNLGILATGTVGTPAPVTISGLILLDPDDQPVSAVPVAGEITIIPGGDANLDGAVNVLDLSKVIRMILNYDPETSAGDANVDGNTDVLDITEIVKIILGIS